MLKRNVFFVRTSHNGRFKSVTKDILSRLNVLSLAVKQVHELLAGLGLVEST